MVCLKRSGKMCPSSHTPCPMNLFHWVAPYWYSFIIKQKSNKQNVSLSSVSCSRKLIKTRERVIGISNLTVIRSGAQVTRWACNCHLNGGLQFERTKPLTCGIWCYLQKNSVRIELNVVHPVGITEMLGSAVKKSRNLNWSQNPMEQLKLS